MGPDEDTGRPRFVGGAVVRRRALPRVEFVDEFAGRLPVVHEQGAHDLPALHRWDPEYLVARAGEARLELLAGVYEADARRSGFARARTVSTNLRAFVEAVVAGDASQGYLFNTPTGIFQVNERDGELRVGWGKEPNPGLTVLASDFEVPAFMNRADLIYAALLLGGPRQRAPLHYDLSGEVKALVQLRGRKRVVLFPPSQARFLSFPGWFEAGSAPFRVPHAAEVDLDRPDFDRHPELARARGLETVLQPGDILYWPAFWAHDITNLDAFTLAVTCSFEELRASCMSFREQLGLLGRLFLREVEGQASGLPRAELESAFRRLEQRLFSDELHWRTTLWGWSDAVWHANDGRPQA
ncbi:MAG TPA: cupin-like domain-containing protein [Planctomycetota bacterium]